MYIFPLQHISAKLKIGWGMLEVVIIFGMFFESITYSICCYLGSLRFSEGSLSCYMRVICCYMVSLRFLCSSFSSKPREQTNRENNLGVPGRSSQQPQPSSWETAADRTSQQREPNGRTRVNQSSPLAQFPGTCHQPKRTKRETPEESISNLSPILEEPLPTKGTKKENQGEPIGNRSPIPYKPPSTQTNQEGGPGRTNQQP